MLLGSTFTGPIRATPGAHARCPHCDGELVAKCGSIVIWHWAHRHADCDPWVEPETAWHLRWKQYFLERGHDIEVTREVDGERHRADVVLRSGAIVELQWGYQAVTVIHERERFWTRVAPGLAWIYAADRFAKRIHWTDRGFWWKHGAQSTTQHTTPVWWDLSGELLHVSLALGERHDTFGFADGHRVVGRVLDRVDPWEL